MPNCGRRSDAYGNDAPPFVPQDTDATETEHELFGTLSWRHALAGGGELHIAPFYKLSTGALNADPTHALGPAADPGATASSVTRRSHDAGAIAEWSLPRGGHQWKAGVTADVLFGRTDFTEWHQAMGGGIDSTMTTSGTDRTTALRYSAYLQDRWQRGRLTVDSGVRVDGMHLDLSRGQTNEQAGISPRVGASVLFSPAVSVRAAAGLGWVPPPLLDAGSAARIHGDAADGLPWDLRGETDAFAELGADFIPARWLRLGATGWGRYAWNQLDDDALGSTGLLGYFNFARGRAVGAEAGAQVALGRWLSGFANVAWEINQGQTIVSSRYLFTSDELMSNEWETLDESQRWTVNAGATVRSGNAFASVLVDYGSGLRTGASNTATVPDHIAVDLTLHESFAALPLRPQLAIDVMNLFDAHYTFRLANGLIGSSWAPPREVFVRLAFPLGGAAL